MYMLSDNMEKNCLMVGKHCMELSGIVLPLGSSYSLLTTDIAAHDSLCIYPSCVGNITLSDEEMSQFVLFFSNNKCLHKIGFSESSVLFIAKRRKIKVAVVDAVTQCVCNELGIETINVQSRKTVTPETLRPIVDSKASRLRLFKIAACL